MHKSHIREMAKMYRELHPDYSRAVAVGKAYEAYDIFRDAEFELQIRSKFNESEEGQSDYSG